MLPAYIQLLWKVPFWLGLTSAGICATIACVRPTVRSAESAVTIGWITAWGWIALWLACWASYEYRLGRFADSPQLLAASAARYRQVASAGFPLAAVLVGVLVGYGRMKFAVKLPPQLRSKQRLAEQYYKQVMKHPPKAPQGRGDAR